jgi:hypothetical protein
VILGNAITSEKSAIASKTTPDVARGHHPARPGPTERFAGGLGGEFVGLWKAHGRGTAFDIRRAMNKHAPGSNMNEHEFQSKLAELMTEISTLPVTERKKLEQLADETRQRHERLRATVSSLQESLDYLRLSIKYLVFDLEATRRENGYLRKMLEETSGND